MISLKEEHIGKIKEHGEHDYADECCGLLIGHFETDGKKIVVETYPLQNAREEEARHNRTLILPKDLLRVERYAREKKMDVVGYYHSHPEDRAVPSQYDLDHALPVWSYIIVSVLQGKAADLRSWEMETDRSKFNEEVIIKE
jgi:proteasome lid subunit RPN8/RPN11